jgi:hypothetical protein
MGERGAAALQTPPPPPGRSQRDSRLQHAVPVVLALAALERAPHVRHHPQVVPHLRSKASRPPSAPPTAPPRAVGSPGVGPHRPHHRVAHGVVVGARVGRQRPHVHAGDVLRPGPRRSAQHRRRGARRAWERRARCGLPASAAGASGAAQAAQCGAPTVQPSDPSVDGSVAITVLCALRSDRMYGPSCRPQPAQGGTRARRRTGTAAFRRAGARKGSKRRGRLS